jgi:CelD/BcsL family acetyltransferase involved in cellulose biosynthesis
MPNAYEAEVISSPSRLTEALREWNDFIASDDVDTGVFSDPLVIERSADFGAGQKMVLVTCSEDGRKAGLIPLRLSRRRMRLTLGAWRVGSVAADVLKLCDAAFPVRRGKDRLALLIGARDAIRRQTSSDLMIAENCIVGSPDRPSEGAVAQNRTFWMRNVQRTYCIAMPEDFQSYLSAFGAKTRYNLKSQLKKLQKASGNDLALRRFSEPGAMEELSAHLVLLWEKSWHGRTGSGAPPTADSMKCMAQAGWVRSYVLMAKGEPIAYVVGYQYKSVFYYESIAYDPKWKTHSPGSVMNYLMLEDLFKCDRPAVVDFGFGYNVYKEVLGNRPEDRADMWMPLSSHGEAILLCTRALQRVYRMGKAAASTAGLAGRLRSLRRGTPSGQEDRTGFGAKARRMAQRMRAQGIGRSLSYILVTVLLERLGISIFHVFEAVEEEAARFTAKDLKLATLKNMASFTPADIEALKSYGGPRLLRQFETAFARHEACATARRSDGKLAGTVWWTMTRDYAPAKRPECALFERGFTFPEYRGLGVLPAVLAYGACWNREQHPELGAAFGECSVSNAASKRGILKAGFKPIGILITVGRWKYFWDRRSAASRRLVKEEPC